jgi:hypothetical protein
VVALKHPGEDEGGIPLLQGKTGGGEVTVYVCENITSREPLRGAAAVEAGLKG